MLHTDSTPNLPTHLALIGTDIGGGCRPIVQGVGNRCVGVSRSASASSLISCKGVNCGASCPPSSAGYMAPVFTSRRDDAAAAPSRGIPVLVTHVGTAAPPQSFAPPVTSALAAPAVPAYLTSDTATPSTTVGISVATSLDSGTISGFGLSNAAGTSTPPCATTSMASRGGVLRGLAELKVPDCSMPPSNVADEPCASLATRTATSPCGAVVSSAIGAVASAPLRVPSGISSQSTANSCGNRDCAADDQTLANTLRWLEAEQLRLTTEHASQVQVFHAAQRRLEEEHREYSQALQARSSHSSVSSSAWEPQETTCPSASSRNSNLTPTVHGCGVFAESASAATRHVLRPHVEQIELPPPVPSLSRSADSEVGQMSFLSRRGALEQSLAASATNPVLSSPSLHARPAPCFASEKPKRRPHSLGAFVREVVLPAPSLVASHAATGFRPRGSTSESDLFPSDSGSFILRNDSPPPRGLASPTALPDSPGEVDDSDAMWSIPSRLLQSTECVLVPGVDVVECLSVAKSGVEPEVHVLSEGSATSSSDEGQTDKHSPELSNVSPDAHLAKVLGRLGGQLGLLEEILDLVESSSLDAAEA